ncbi:bifunctional diguanylate cyclase/phosphodiesterase [Tsuneonella rigui]|uniref:bifunctional diguanylate cyclase/phosphodiesterase n=1 Tax=Tsuneonella rigui TaxID=1708790 RepID=UPI000F7F4623|nr:bifunctional diguanylate cyclase/phosphodiesterase [Tsuneonella rigui]
MVALTTVALIVAMSAIGGAGSVDWRNLLFIVGCSGTATLFVLSLLHSDLRALYRTLAQSAETAEREAKTDSLTGGQNRRAFLDALEEAHTASLGGSYACLIFIDLDGFKRVNDTLGHQSGDEVLRSAFDRMAEVVGPQALFRLSGDEFAVILDRTTVTVAQGVCHEVRRRVGGSYRIGGRACMIGCSAGLVALDASTTESPSDAMRKADIAMYKAKLTRSGVEVFDDDLLRLVTRRAELGEKLRRSLDDHIGLNTHFQSVVGRDLRPVALEALFRWYDDDWGDISPDEAIAVAKEFRLLEELSLYVVRACCRAAAAQPHVQISINVEASQLLDTRFVSSLEAILAEEEVDAARFILEIGEGEIAKHGTRIEPMMAALAEAGFALAVDNFGSSNVSLTFLAKLGVSHVKLDRSFLRHARDLGSIAIMRANVRLAKSLNMSVTCEAISDPEDEAIARQANSDFFQGYHFSMPQPLVSILVAHEAIAARTSAGMGG